MLDRALFLVTIAGGATLGVFWPLSKDETPAAPSALEITIDRSADKHFYANANVNGRDIRFLVDTGASETALTEEDARKAGIAIDPQQYELLGQGASGIVRGQYVELETIDLGGIDEKNARAVVVQGATISLLGQPFLESIEEIVIRKGEMVLRDKKDS